MGAFTPEEKRSFRFWKHVKGKAFELINYRKEWLDIEIRDGSRRDGE